MAESVEEEKSTAISVKVDRRLHEKAKVFYERHKVQLGFDTYQDYVNFLFERQPETINKALELTADNVVQVSQEEFDEFVDELEDYKNELQKYKDDRQNLFAFFLSDYFKSVVRAKGFPTTPQHIQKLLQEFNQQR